MAAKHTSSTPSSAGLPEAPKRRNLSFKVHDVLKDRVRLYEQEVQPLIQRAVKAARESGNVVLLDKWLRDYDKVEKRLVEICNALLPYEESRKASIDVRQESTTKFVFHVPQKFKTAEEWMRAHGVTQLDQTKLEAQRQAQKAKAAEPRFIKELGIFEDQLVDDNDEDRSPDIKMTH